MSDSEGEENETAGILYGSDRLYRVQDLHGGLY